MNKRYKDPDYSSDIRCIILPLFSIFYLAIVLLNLMRVAFTSGEAFFLWLWVPNLTPLHTSVISLIILIAFLGAILLLIVAISAIFPSGFSGKLMRSALLFFAAIIVAYVLILDSFGQAAAHGAEMVYEKFEDHEYIRLEGANEIKEVLDALREK